MRQRVFTEEQHELLGRLEQIFKEAKEKDISFVYDIGDGSLTAFNSQNIPDYYAGKRKEDDTDEKIDWETSSIIENASIDYFDGYLQDYYLKFE